MSMGTLPTELGRHRSGGRSVAFEGRMGWVSLVPARGKPGDDLQAAVW